MSISNTVKLGAGQECNQNMVVHASTAIRRRYINKAEQMSKVKKVKQVKKKALEDKFTKSNAEKDCIKLLFDYYNRNCVW